MKNQKGFSAIQWLLLLIILFLLIFTGWYVWQSKKKSDQSYNQAAATNQTAKKKKSSKTAESPKHLTIKEWMVRVKLTSEIFDAYYLIKPGAPNYAYLSVDSLKNVDQCGADKTSLGAYARVKDGELDDNGNPVLQDYPDAVKVGGYYYYESRPQAFCSEDATTKAKAEAAVKDFIDSGKTFEATPN